MPPLSFYFFSPPDGGIAAAAAAAVAAKGCWGYPGGRGKNLLWERVGGLYLTPHYTQIDDNDDCIYLQTCMNQQKKNTHRNFNLKKKIKRNYLNFDFDRKIYSQFVKAYCVKDVIADGNSADDKLITIGLLF